VLNDKFITDLVERLKQPLPGAIAHEPMRATPKGSVLPNFSFKEAPRKGAVLILLYPDKQQLFFPLIKRAIYKGVHSGQIALPGGKFEPGDKNVLDTALREAEEEIGIIKSKVEIIGQLSDFFVIPSNFMVSPVLGFTSERPKFQPDSTEVEKVLDASLQFILYEESIKRKTILAGGLYEMDAPCFEVAGETVWGATAMMINELRLILKDIGL
jgi:8-oxo-dGTP pyrophosphatase MutT (NUDIX family)